MRGSLDVMMTSRHNDISKVRYLFIAHDRFRRLYDFAAPSDILLREGAHFFDVEAGTSWRG